MENLDPPSAPVLNRKRVVFSLLMLPLMLAVFSFGFFLGTNTRIAQHAQIKQTLSVSPTPAQITEEKNTKNNIESAVLPLTEFQKALHAGCKPDEYGVKKIAAQSLLIVFDSKKTMREISPTAQCEYNIETNTFWVEINMRDDQSLRRVEVYDRLSEKLIGHGVVNFYYEESTRHTDDISYSIGLGASDYVPPVEQNAVRMSAVKRIYTKHGEEIYVRSEIPELIPAGDSRLVRLLMKYKENDQDGSFGEPGRTPLDLLTYYDEIQEDIHKTFFSNMYSLQNPEKTNFDRFISFIDSFQIKQ